jgi:hypothetical protein
MKRKSMFSFLTIVLILAILAFLYYFVIDYKDNVGNLENNDVKLPNSVD